MKAVVAEIRVPYAAVLTEDGIFRKIRNQNYTVGQVIELENRQFGKRHAWYHAAAAAALVFIIGSGALWYTSSTVMAYSVVTISVDGAEVELVMNRRDEVISARAVDETDTAAANAAEKVQASKSNRKSLEEALEMIADGGQEEIVSVYSRNAEREQGIEDKAREVIQNAGQQEIQADSTEEPFVPHGMQEENAGETFDSPVKESTAGGSAGQWEQAQDENSISLSAGDGNEVSVRSGKEEISGRDGEIIPKEVLTVPEAEMTEHEPEAEMPGPPETGTENGPEEAVPEVTAPKVTEQTDIPAQDTGLTRP